MELHWCGKIVNSCGFVCSTMSGSTRQILAPLTLLVHY